MANEAGKNERRLAINYWNGVNAIVDKGLAKPQEFLHIENGRSKTIGALEKREGQTVLGTDPSGGVFTSRENYGLAFAATGSPPVNGLYRMSASTETSLTPPVLSYSSNVSDSVSVKENLGAFVLSAQNIARVEYITLFETVTVTVSSIMISVNDSVSLSDNPMPSVAGERIYIQFIENISITEPPMFGIIDRFTMYLDNTDYDDVNLYRLDALSHWQSLPNADAKNIAAADFSYTVLEGKVFLVNGRDYNRYVDQDGVTIVTSRHNDAAAGPGDLYNTPRSKLINAYKGRLYLANYDWEGIHHGNTVLQSSPPLGIIALVQSDVTGPSTSQDTAAGKSFFSGNLDSGLASYYSLNEVSGFVKDSFGANDLTLYTGSFTGTTAGSPTATKTITSVSSVAKLTIGMAITSTTAGVIPSGTYITSVGTTSVGVSQNITTNNSGITFNVSTSLPARVTGINGNAGDFSDNTISKMVYDNTTLGLNGVPFSMALWFKAGVNSNSNGTLGLASFGNANTGFQYEIQYEANGNSQPSTINFDQITSTSEGFASGSVSFDTNWHHAVLTSDGTTITGYIDGVSIGTGTPGGTSLTFTPGMAIGASFRHQTCADSYIDEVATWGRVLTASEVTALYSTGYGKFYGYPFKWQLPVTDTTFLYTDTYANQYEIWRLGTKIADVTINALDDTNMYADDYAITWATSTHSFLSQDQVYVKGSVTGPKVFRWPNNPTLSGQDVKQFNTFKLSGGDESDITMMANVGNVMLVSNRSVIASWNDYILNYFDLGIGCASRRGYTKGYGALYFIHYTGIYASSGGLPNIISSPVQPYIDGATKSGIENAVAGKKGRSIFFCIGQVTLYNPDGSVKRTLQDTCLEYNILQQSWYVHTNVAAADFETFLDSTADDRLSFTDSKSKEVKTFLEGTTDAGSEIFFRADTQRLPISPNIEDLSNAELIIVESERGSSMECYVALDDGDFYQLEGAIEKGVTRLRVHGRDYARGEPPVCHYITVSFRDGSKQRCKLGRVAITFVPAGASDPP